MITVAQVRAALAQRRPREGNAPEAQPAAVALVLVEGTPPRGVELLLIKRAQQAGDPWSGQMALPGGRREASDVDLLATAVRETHEETGVVLERTQSLGALDDLVPVAPTLPPVLVRPFVFAVAGAPGPGARPALVTNREVERALWVPLERFSDPDVRSDVTFTLRGVERTFPAYRLGDDVVWGMTERILTPFLGLVR